MKNNQSNAKFSVSCDECGASLGELYPNNKDNISIPLTNISKTNKGDSETSYNNRTQNHFCNEQCLASNLNKRAKILAKLPKISKSSQIENGVLILNIPNSKKKVE